MLGTIPWQGEPEAAVVVGVEEREPEARTEALRPQWEGAEGGTGTGGRWRG
jgi:hypothetical protein